MACSGRSLMARASIRWGSMEIVARGWGRIRGSKTSASVCRLWPEGPSSTLPSGSTAGGPLTESTVLTSRGGWLESGWGVRARKVWMESKRVPLGLRRTRLTGYTPSAGSAMSGPFVSASCLVVVATCSETIPLASGSGRGIREIWCRNNPVEGSASRSRKADRDRMGRPTLMSTVVSAGASKSRRETRKMSSSAIHMLWLTSSKAGVASCEGVLSFWADTAESPMAGVARNTRVIARPMARDRRLKRNSGLKDHLQNL